MKRLCAGVATLAVGALLVAMTGSAGAQGPVAESRASLRGFDCHRALDPANRSVSVTAVMRPLQGTRHLALKFELLSASSAAAAPTAVHAGDLGVWITPQLPTLGQLPGDVWNLQKSVVSLAAPARYRFRVVFRWTGAQDRVLGSVVRYSPKCYQPELRPDLLVQSIAVSALADHPNSDLYTAVIANAGNSAAGPFQVLFTLPDGGASTRTVQLLRAHSSTTASFVGPICSSSNAPTITADSTDEVDDLNRANNAMTATCPASPGS